MRLNFGRIAPTGLPPLLEVAAADFWVRRNNLFEFTLSLGIVQSIGLSCTTSKCLQSGAIVYGSASWTVEETESSFSLEFGNHDIGRNADSLAKSETTTWYSYL